MELKDILLKTSPELSGPEKEFLRQNTDKLNDEDKAAYADFLTPEPAPVEPAAPATPAVTPTEPVTPATPATPTTYSFKSEEEMREFVRKEVEAQKQSDADAKQKAMDAAKTEAERRYIDENWKPKDWKEARNQLFQEFKEELAKEKEKEEKDKAVKYWNDQWTELSKEKGLKPLTDPEGARVHAQIINLMRGYGLNTFKAGYEMWEKVNGVVNGTPANADPKKDPAPNITPSQAAAVLAKSKTDAQKKAAAKVGAANASDEKPANPSGVKPFGSYEEMKKASSRGILRDL